MRSFILIPTLALINMGANAATIGGAINRQTGGQLEVANRQLHNADFSSSTPDGSTPAPALGDSTGPSSATSPSAARRRVADLPAGVPPPVADALGKATDATMTTSTSKRDGNIAFGSLESQEDAMLADINKLYDPTVNFACRMGSEEPGCENEAHELHTHVRRGVNVSVDKSSVSRSGVDLHKHARKATLARFANVSVSGNQGEVALSSRASDVNDVVNAADVFGPRDVVSTAGNTIAGVSPVSPPSPPSSLKAPRAFEGSGPAEDNSSESDAPAPPAAPAAVAGALEQAKTIVGGVGGASVPEYRRFILSPPRSGVHHADKRHEEIEEIDDHDLDLTDSVLEGAYARRGVGIKYGTVSGALNPRRSVNIDDGLFSAAASKRGVNADAGTGLASAVISSKRAVNVDGVPKANIGLVSASAAFNRRDLDVDFKPANPSKPVVNVAAGRLPAEAQKRQIGVNAAFSPAGTPGAPASNRDVEVDSGVVPVGAVTAERRDLDLEDVTTPAGPLPNLPVAPPSGL